MNIEDDMKRFIVREKSHFKFRPMPAIKRKIIHELCVHYGCTSLSYGTDPGRFVKVIKSNG